MYCRNIYCNSLRTLRYWHLNIPTVTITTSFVLQDEKAIPPPPFYTTTRTTDVTRRTIIAVLLTTEFFYSLSISLQYTSTFFTNNNYLCYSIEYVDKKKKEKKYANNLNVDQVTSLANLLSSYFL